MKRKSGVLMHISSLFGDYSCGGFSKEAKEFIDFLADCGFSIWQVLPFNPVDEFGSPYKSSSAFAGNIYFIDLEELLKMGLLTAEELCAAKQNVPYAVEFSRLFKERGTLLKKAAQRADFALKEKVFDFMRQNTEIKNYCTFAALKEKNKNKNREWQTWTDFEVSDESVFCHMFCQYIFFEQWKKIKEYATQKCIEIIGDVPFYVSPDSADTYFDRKQFCLDEKGYPLQVAGVPPDYFSSEGQLWGSPVYDFLYMKSDGFEWWKKRIGHMLFMFDGLRIDHFRAFEAFWSVPADEKTAANGHWVKGPGEELVEILKKESKEKLIIAEDLGDITPEVHDLLQKSGFPGMRVFQFGFLSEDDSVHKPHNYTNNSVCYTGTHDNNTLLGYLWELDGKKRREVLSYCGYNEPDWERGYENMIRSVMASAAGIAVFPIQDVLKFGCDTRLNTPGRAEGNWSFRITKKQLCSVDRAYWKGLNKAYGRI